MRTRARGAAAPTPPLSSSPPQTRSRKRNSAAACDHDQQDEIAADQPPPGGPPTSDGLDSDTILLTPRKTKRVRFSDPGVRVYEVTSSSTGLTPSMRRTKLLGKARRTTLPPRFSPPSSPPPPPQELQFMPLKQVLDNRLRRRLKRSHLSEELNDIDEHRREEERALRELEQLRAQGQHSEDKIKDLMFELESQRQLSINVNSEEEEHVRRLQEELDRLRSELYVQRDTSPPRGPPSEVPTEVATDMATELASDDEDVWEDNEYMVLGSPLRGASSSSPLPRLDSDDCIQLSTPPSSSPPRVHAGVQVTSSVKSFTETHVHDLSQQLAEAKQEASDASAALKLLKDDLCILGFTESTQSDADAENIIASIQNTFRHTRLELERLLPGETADGFENARLLPAMLEHVNSLLQRLRKRDKVAERAMQAEEVMRGQFNATLEKVGDLENRITILMAQRQEAVSESKRKDQLVKDIELSAQARVAIINDRDATVERLEKTLDETRTHLSAREHLINKLKEGNSDKNVAIDRFQNAIKSYQDEIASLESLSQRLEADKLAAEERAAELEAEMEQVKGDREMWEADYLKMRKLATEAKDFIQKGEQTDDKLAEAIHQAEKRQEEAKQFAKGLDDRITAVDLGDEWQQEMDEDA